MTVSHIFEISEDDHPHTVSHARDHWLTLDFANAFVSPGVNSRGELVASLRLGIKCLTKNHLNCTKWKYNFDIVVLTLIKILGLPCITSGKRAGLPVSN